MSSPLLVYSDRIRAQGGRIAVEVNGSGMTCWGKRPPKKSGNSEAEERPETEIAGVIPSKHGKG